MAPIERPLPALLSQTLVAFTVEVDNEFESRMLAAGYPGGRLSLVLWLNLVRHFENAASTVEDLISRSGQTKEAVLFQLGCLERWRFVSLEGGRRRRDWGTGRRIRFTWTVSLTPQGRMAAVVWPAALDTVEGRWGFRFGKPKVDRLRACLGRILKRTSPEVPLPALLAQVLSTFAVEFNRKSPAPLDLCASVLRVLARGPVAVREIPLLTGSSPEMTAIGWRLKPFVIVSTVQGRGKVASLTPAGIKAHRAYVSLLKRVEERWRERFGSTIADLKGTLAGIFEVREGGRSKLAMGMSPPPGTVRGGEIAPSLGRRALGPAARQRARDLVVQTQAFMRDPANALPHYPLWDMNRGFGP